MSYRRRNEPSPLEVEPSTAGATGDRDLVNTADGCVVPSSPESDKRSDGNENVDRDILLTPERQAALEAWLMARVRELTP